MNVDEKIEVTLGIERKTEIELGTVIKRNRYKNCNGNRNRNRKNIKDKTLIQIVEIGKRIFYISIPLLSYLHLSVLREERGSLWRRGGWRVAINSSNSIRSILQAQVAL